MTSSSSRPPDEPADTTATSDASEFVPPSTPAPAAETDLGLDQIFELLSNQRRRYVLQYLKEVDDQATTSDLAEQIAAWENDKDLQRITSGERKRAYVGLYQGHLPKLDDMGVISFNQPRGIIEPAENIDYVYPYLEADDDHTDGTWATYYAGLSVASVLALGGAGLLEPVTTASAVTVVASVSLLAFLTITGAYYWTQRDNGDR